MCSVLGNKVPYSHKFSSTYGTLFFLSLTGVREEEAFLYHATISNSSLISIYCFFMIPFCYFQVNIESKE